MTDILHLNLLTTGSPEKNKQILFRVCLVVPCLFIEAGPVLAYSIIRNCQGYVGGLDETRDANNGSVALVFITRNGAN